MSSSSASSDRGSAHSHSVKAVSGLSTTLSHKRLHACSGLLDGCNLCSQLSRDLLVGEEVHQPATLGSAGAMTPFAVNIVPGAPEHLDPVALTGSCSGHLHPAAMHGCVTHVRDTSSPRQQGKRSRLGQAHLAQHPHGQLAQCRRLCFILVPELPGWHV